MWYPRLNLHNTLINKYISIIRDPMLPIDEKIAPLGLPSGFWTFFKICYYREIYHIHIYICNIYVLIYICIQMMYLTSLKCINFTFYGFNQIFHLYLKYLSFTFKMKTHSRPDTIQAMTQHSNYLCHGFFNEQHSFHAEI